MISKIFFTGTTNKKRHKVIDDLQELIQKNGGWIEDHKLFSNQMANFIVDIENQYFDKLVSNLSTLPITWEFSYNEEKLSSLPDNKEIQISITINFMIDHDEIPH